MDIIEFRKILTAFAEEPSDVDIRPGKFVAQIRDDLIEAKIAFSTDGENRLLVSENDQQYPARLWLLNRVAKLPQLADRIIASTTPQPEIATKSPFVVPSGYISPDLSETGANEDQPVENVADTLIERASKPIPGATSVVYVTSDAGEGKTTVINQVANMQAKNYKSKKATSLVVPIPLSGRAFLTFDDAVIAALVNKLRFNYFYFDAFIQLVKMGVVVPAFDGYEEMLVEGSKNEAVSTLGQLIQSLESSGTIFISARKAFFEYISFKTQARLLDAIRDRSASFSRIQISRWSKEQFLEYGKLRKVSNSEKIYETVVSRLGHDHPLLTRAVLVRRLFDVASNISNHSELEKAIGANPQDYFFTFVDTIVKREASEKWLAKVSGEIMEPLLETDEHHQLLTSIALEMWQSSTNSIRHDVLDVIVDIFADGKKKNASQIRQIKERLKQHSLLVTDGSRKPALSFDHEDFQNFYLGEGLGYLLSSSTKSDIQAFLSVNLVPITTIDQSISHLMRKNSDLKTVLNTLLAINESETGFSYCKENCGALVIRIIGGVLEESESVILNTMLFSTESLSGRSLRRILFKKCHFQPTGLSKSILMKIEFYDCHFERLEIEPGDDLSTCTFTNCSIDSLLLKANDEQTFDPEHIEAHLLKAGAKIGGKKPITSVEDVIEASDNRLKILERFLRVFLRKTSVGDEVIRLRLGKSTTSFYDEILPRLREHNVLEELSWTGQGFQHRYKLGLPMSEVNQALERANGSFEGFLSAIKNIRK